MEADSKQEAKNQAMRSKLGPSEGKIGRPKVLGRMNNENSVSKQKCSGCGSTNLKEDTDIVKCLDCGMGKYKGGRHKA